MNYELLIEAAEQSAERIAKRGLQHNSKTGPNGERCTINTVYDIMQFQLQDYILCGLEEWDQMLLMLCQVTGLSSPSLVARWNDHEATQQQAVDVFEKIAKNFRLKRDGIEV